MRRVIARAVLAATFTATLLIPVSAHAAVDVFLRMANINGESVLERNAVDILSWSWGLATGSARTAKGVLPAACVQDLNLMKRVDSASPQLVMNGTTGTVAADATLVMRKAGGRQEEFLVLEMTNVTVVSFQLSGSSEIPTESVTLRFESMTGKYFRQKPDGSLDKPIEFTVGGNTCR
jgi:type VI secretion system secreted protein Hcp